MTNRDSFPAVLVDAGNNVYSVRVESKERIPPNAGPYIMITGLQDIDVARWILTHMPMISDFLIENLMITIDTLDSQGFISEIQDAIDPLKKEDES